MIKTVALNAGKLDFDGKLAFAPLTQLTDLTRYAASSQSDILDRVQDQTVIISKELPLGGELIRQMPDSVKLICEAGTGYNNIDITAAREKKITVCNVPGYSTGAVAQLAIACILNFSSSLSLQKTMLQAKDFSNFTRHLQVPHFELNAKTLGLIGAGAISRQTAVVAHALGMNILVYSRSRKDWADFNASFVSLDEVLAAADFLSIHCPLTPETRHLLDRHRFGQMKSTAYIINTARGPIIHEADLIDALQNKRLAGAALDVQDPEPPALDNPLFTMDNVLLTPHIGWQTLESRQRLIGLLADNIAAWLQGKPVNTVA